jgi:hypothetical protein
MSMPTPHRRLAHAPRRRRGFVLPFVLLALAAGSLFTLAFTSEALQAIRAVRASVLGDDVGYRADAALAEALSIWTQDSLWRFPPGAAQQRSLVVQGEAITIEWHRLHPLAATVRAIGEHAAARRLDVAVRDHIRAVWLAPPPFAIPAALTTNGEVSGAEGTLVSGSDLRLPGSVCGATRDTASVAAVAAAGVTESAAGSWPGAPVSVGPPPATYDSVRRALAVLAARVPPVLWDATPRALPAAPAWHALHIEGPHVVLAGPMQWRGLLVVRGDVTITGPVEVTGLLVVEGQLDASAGQLAVQGAVLAADTLARGVMLGANGRLFYDRCAVQMALATAARPSLGPFSLWHSLPH